MGIELPADACFIPHSPFPIPHYIKKGCEDVNKKQKNLLLRIIIAAVFFVPLYLIS